MARTLRALIALGVVAAATSMVVAPASATLARQAAVQTCGGPIRVVPPEDVPVALRADAKGDGLVGSGTIWTPPRSLSEQPGYSTEERYYRLKMPWLRSKPGRLKLTGTRVDGAGRFWADTAKPGEYPSVGFEPSALMFSTGGCWKIIARHRRSTFVFYMDIAPAMPT
jgi:hypothetical protein